MSVKLVMQFDTVHYLQTNVVDYIRVKGGLAETYSVDEINRAIGILRYHSL